MSGTINGVGTTFYGRKEIDAYDGSFITTKWVVVLYLPIIPLGSYRLKNEERSGIPFFGEKRSYEVVEKAPLNLIQVLFIYLYSAGIFLGPAIVGISNSKTIGLFIVFYMLVPEFVRKIFGQRKYADQIHMHNDQQMESGKDFSRSSEATASVMLNKKLPNNKFTTNFGATFGADHGTGVAPPTDRQAGLSPRSLTFKVLGVVLGLLFSGAAVFSIFEAKHIKSIGKVAIVDSIERYKTSALENSSAFTFQAANGKIITKYHSFSDATLQDLKKGIPVRVYYDPKNPDEFVFEKDWEQWHFVAMGIAFAFGALLFA